MSNYSYRGTPFSKNEIYTRHGGAYDRGSADKYYGRPPEPHFFIGDTYNSEKIEESKMNKEEIEAYMAGYNEETDQKDWG